MDKYLRHLIVIIILFTLGHTAGAQTYRIRVEFNTNIRAQPSLDAARLETAPAGTILEVLGQSNRWLRVNRGDEAWMAAWVTHERIEGQPAAEGNIDNCCFVDLQCSTNQEWVNGYWAFQNGQCQAPASASQPSAPEPTAASQVSDNCCGINRQCHSEQEWVDGYWAYQRGQCGAPSQIQSGIGNCCDSGWNCTREHEFIYGGWSAQHNRCFQTPNSLPPQSFGPYVDHGHIRIVELSPGFGGMVNTGFELLRTRAPQWYSYVNNAITEVQERHCCGTGVFGALGVIVYHHAPQSIRPYIRRDDYTMAGTLVHEACHVYQAREGRGIGGDLSWTNEYECELYAWDAARLMGGPTAPSASPNNADFMNDPLNRAHWWWNP